MTMIHFITEKLSALGSKIVPRRWFLDSYWIRLPFVRYPMLWIGLANDQLIRGEDFALKIASLSRYVRDAVVSDPLFFEVKKKTPVDLEKELLNPFAHSEYVKSKRDARSRITRHFGARIGDRIRRSFFDCLTPNSRFRDHLTGFLLDCTGRGRERYFSFGEIVSLDKKIVRYAGQKKGVSRKPIFTRENQKRFQELLSLGSMDAVPEGYIKEFYPQFKTNEFVRNKASFHWGEKRLFALHEVNAVVEYLSRHLCVRNPERTMQRIAPRVKKWSIAVLAVAVLIPFLFDIFMLLYGYVRNDYTHSALFTSKEVLTINSPFARRSNRISVMNNSARFTEFDVKGSLPYSSTRYKIDNTGQLAVELSYPVYRAIRIQDQIGLTVLTIEEEKLSELRITDRRTLERVLDFIIVKGWWEELAYAFDDFTDDLFNVYDPLAVPLERIRGDIAIRVSNAPAPTRWMQRLNECFSFVTVWYHKPNTRKWIPLDEFPRIMREAIILREDRRFRNDLFPVPHRGNDNIVIVPQIVKRLICDILKSIYRFGSEYELSWMENFGRRYYNSVYAIYTSDMRGGSSISNQVMEMLYTRDIPNVVSRFSGIEQDKKIEQKKFELPASLMVDWFWTEDEILEAYINEVYGGHLRSDIIGFRSQAEMYFSRGLDELNLREQIMLVGAVKKPSRIKEYALWLKADELRELIQKKGAASSLLRAWEAENSAFDVNRHNYPEILKENRLSKEWIDQRTDFLLHLLHRAGEISHAEYTDALSQQIAFNFASSIYSRSNRLVNNIKREIDGELGTDRSDSGLVVLSSIDRDMQDALQGIIDRISVKIAARSTDADSDDVTLVMLDGGARIVHANEKRSGEFNVVNRIIADVGGSSKGNDEWDWITQANRSLGSSLKPLLVFYFLLEGFNLSDQLKDTKLTYRNYSLEQERVYQNFIHRYPHRDEDIDEITENWLWSPKNYQRYSESWVNVRRALVHSINSVHVQIQEIVTPEVFAQLLNEMMNIDDAGSMHKAYRSLVLGGSDGDQRYDKFLLAFSVFPNRGILKKHTYLKAVMLPDGTVLSPNYRSLESALLEKFGRDYVEAACMVLNDVLRQTVREGSMSAMRGVGAGKTGTSNDFKDALATLHFMADDDTYIAGVRLGNRANRSIGKAAHQIATPLLAKIVRRLFQKRNLVTGDAYDEKLKNELESNPFIVRVKGEYYLKGGTYKPRRLFVSKIKKREKVVILRKAEDLFQRERYREAAELYERFLHLATEFDSEHPAFHNMVQSYIHLGNLQRVTQLLERFARSSQMVKLERMYERRYGISLELDQRLHNRPNYIPVYSEKREDERRKRLIHYADNFVKQWRMKNAVKSNPEKKPRVKRGKELILSRKGEEKIAEKEKKQYTPEKADSLKKSSRKSIESNRVKKPEENEKRPTAGKKLIGEEKNKQKSTDKKSPPPLEKLEKSS